MRPNRWGANERRAFLRQENRDSHGGREDEQIGFATARCLAEQGAALALVDFSEQVHVCARDVAGTWHSRLLAHCRPH